jgi:CRISPR locus-related DNA-binding protein
VGRLFISTLGFDITTVTYLVGRTAFEEGDSLVFVMPVKEVPGRTSQTVAALKEFLEGIIARGVKIGYDFLKVDERDFIGDLIEIVRYVNRGGFGEVFVWVLGGTRAIVSLLTAYSMLDPRVKGFFTYSESHSDVVNVSKFGFNRFRVDRRLLNVLKHLVDVGRMSLTDLCNLYKLNYQRGYRLVSKMSSLGLIDRHRGRRIEFSINKYGLLYIELSKAFKD